MNWYTILIIIFFFVLSLIIVTIRVRHGAYSKGIKSVDYLEDNEEVKRRETFREMVRNSISKY